ncbi:MAG: GspE/PulE family protein [Gammaproteobacteria bacterium]|nr:GspE/PulE family protein [Gammaproteobacteria bacterium]
MWGTTMIKRPVSRRRSPPPRREPGREPGRESGAVAAIAAPERLLELREVLDDLAREGRISRGNAETLLASQRTRQRPAAHPLEIVAEQKFPDRKDSGKALTLEALTSWLGDKSGLPYYRIDPLRVNVPQVTAVMSYQYARRHDILAVEAEGSEVVVATAQPFRRDWLPMLQQTLKDKTISVVVANPVSIARYTLEFYSMARSVSKAADTDYKGLGALGVGNFEQLLELGQTHSPEANDAHIVNIVDWLLQYAFDQRASDIHIEPRRERGNVRFRIDGTMQHVYELPALVMVAVVSRLKNLGRMNLAEKRRPQDGRIKTKGLQGNEVELRLSTLPTAFGEKMVLRIFDPDVLLKSFDELGLGGREHDVWQAMIGAPHGIILVTGPTGSGKTTTLYSSLRQLATPEVNVCTIEDPIEMVEPSFNQMQVASNISLHFADGVRSLLRQDPDIIMIGEVRDYETAEVAVQAALTGHLVLSTLHTNDAPSAVIRLLEIGIPAYLIKSALLGVMAQRLVRVLCPNCKSRTAMDKKAWGSMVAPYKAPAPQWMYVPQGCLECRGTGYYGRLGLYEILPVSNAIKRMIGDSAEADALRRAGLKEGMHTLRLAGAARVAHGQTTMTEVLRVTPKADD